MINQTAKKILKALSFDGVEVEAFRHMADLKRLDPMKIFYKKIDEKIYNAEIKENNEIVNLNIINKSKDPKVEITKSCKNITKSNDEIDYSFEIKNTGNVELEDFTWYDYLPTDYAKITGIETGTYNKDIIYNIYYKTNQKDEYMVLKKIIYGFIIKISSIFMNIIFIKSVQIKS